MGAVSTIGGLRFSESIRSLVFSPLPCLMGHASCCDLPLCSVRHRRGGQVLLAVPLPVGMQIGLEFAVSVEMLGYWSCSTLGHASVSMWAIISVA